jgi:hypothetical protein
VVDRYRQHAAAVCGVHSRTFWSRLAVARSVRFPVVEVDTVFAVAAA